MYHIISSLIVRLVPIHIHNQDIHRKHRKRKELEDSDQHNRKMLEIRKKIIITLSHDIRGP